MDKQRIIFESSPGYIIVCLLVALGYAALLYYKRGHSWSNTVNWILFGVRGVLAFMLAFLIMGPIVRQVSNQIEKPIFVFLKDNSGSIKEAVDTTSLRQLSADMINAEEVLKEKGYDVVINDFSGEETQFNNQYQWASSDIQGALRNIANRYESRKVGGVLLVSDGIYNGGLSPLYSNYNFPVYTLGVGDTSLRRDITIKHVAFNKIAYQGNRFPIQVEILVNGFPNQNVAVSLLHQGKVLDRVVQNTREEGFLVYNFQPQANDKGIQRFDIQVEEFPEEYNKRNNHATLFVDIVEGKKKILIVAPSPHPDIKALQAVIEKNSNYEALLFIPGITKLVQQDIKPENIDLAIFHQAPDRRGRTRAVVDQFIKANKSVFLIMGRSSDFTYFNGQNIPVKMDSPPRDFDEVTPVINSSFIHFVLDPNLNMSFSEFPPISIPFARMEIPLSASTLLYQRIGSIITDKPLLSIIDNNDSKIAVLLGEGFWRWRLDEFERVESTTSFDALFGKLIQYMSTQEDKKRFKSNPIEQEFSDTESVVFESQVYNDIFEPVYGNAVDINLTDEHGKKYNYNYVLSPGNARYEIGGLEEGVYHYQASTSINGKREFVRGQFAVLAKMTEIQNLTADFDLLRKLSASTGGEFFSFANHQDVSRDFNLQEAKQVIRSEETYESLINIKLIFWLLLIMVSAEWFARKYFGGY